MAQSTKYTKNIMERKVKVFVTGGTGFLGKYLIKALSKKLSTGSVIYSLERNPAEYKLPKVKPLKGGLEKVDKYSRELRSCDYVFHLAAKATFGSGKDYEVANLQGTINILNILKASRNLKNFIFTSTIGAVDRHPEDNCQGPLSVKSLPTPTSDYGRSKLNAEKAIKDSGLPYTIIRPTWIYGKGMRQNSHINKFVTMAYEKSPILKIKFPGKVSLIEVNDLATALINCLGNKKVIGKIFFGVTESLSLGEIFCTIGKKVDNNFRQIPFFDLGIMEYVVGKWHSQIPLTMSNLLVGYLWAKDNSFKRQLLLKNKIIKFKDGIDGVIKSNIFNDGWWVITGANSGIGLEVTKQLAKTSRKMILVDKSVENLVKIKEAEVRKIDLTADSQIENLVDELKKLNIFCLVNNAGVGFKKSFDEMPWQEIETTIKVNILAPLKIVNSLMEKIKENGTRIINVASSAAYNPLPGMSIYAASKAFMTSWSEALWYEIRKTNKVVTFSPCGTATNFQKNAGVKFDPAGKGLMASDTVAKKIIEAANNKGSIIILGMKSKILMLFGKFVPRPLNTTIQGILFAKAR